MSVGFIKIHRALFDNWVSDEPEALAVWVRILSEANFVDKKKKFNGSIIEVKRGQLIFGLNAFSERSGVSVMKLRRIIADLEADGMINRQKTNRYSLLTVVAYDSYQGLTSQEQANNNPVTIQEQAINTPLTTLEEGKKERSKESKNKPISNQAEKWNKKRFAQELINLGADESHANDWMTSRKTFTETSFKATIKHINNTNQTVAQIVELCAEKGWQGFDAKYLDGLQQKTVSLGRKQPDQSSFLNPVQQRGYIDHE